MKNMKKKILAVSLVISVIAILSMGTLAWFQDDDSVTNDFMIADSDKPITPDNVFSVDIYEEYDVNGDGVIDNNEKFDDGITYDEQQVTPGAKLPKEAYVQNTGKFNQYVRVKVTISDIGVWLSALNMNLHNGLVGAAAAPVAAFLEVDADWVRYDSETYHNVDASTLTFVYYYNGVLEAGSKAEAFLATVTVPTEFTRDHVVGMDGGFSIDLKAEAIQSVNMGVDYSKPHYEIAIASFDVVD